MLGLGHKLEKVAAEHFLDALVLHLKKDGHATIPGVGESRVDLPAKQLIVDLDESFLQKLVRSQ